MREVLLRGLVDPNSDGCRLDQFVTHLEGSPSRSACARLIEDGFVTINETPATSKSERVALGDRIVVRILTKDVQDGRIRPNPDIKLDIRYEDACLLVLSKQAGLVCHPSPGHVDDTLSNALVAHCGWDHVGLLQGDERPGIVHRLDRDTSGLMLAAKDDDTQRQLQDLIRMRVLDRRYVTLVQGYVANDEGTITTGIARSPKDRLRMCVSDDPMSREAITTFRVLERFEACQSDDGFSLIECHLYTGRTHQIRVHMSYIGHPVVGDPVYGVGNKRGRANKRNLGLDRQFLHSWRLSFEHPATGSHIEVEDSLPHDLSEVLLSLSDRSMGRTSAGATICPLLFAPSRNNGDGSKC